jgi:site-specific DNA recombinase
LNIALVRVSSLSQKDNTSLDHQKTKIRQYCELNDINLDLIIEEVESGKTVKSRKGIEHLRTLVEKGEVERVIVLKIDRFSRSLYQGLQFLRYLKSMSVQLISIQEHIDDSLSGKLMLQLLLGLSEFERDTIKNRMLNGKVNKFESGLRSGGGIPYGYYYNDSGKLVMDVLQKKTIRFIFRRWIELVGKSKTLRMQTLLFELKRRGYKWSDGSEFKNFRVKYILKNAYYAGLMITKNLGTIKHNYEYVISERYFNRVQTTFA